MSWKSWPYWVKGAAIGAGVYSIAVISFFLCTIQPRGVNWFQCFGFELFAHPGWNATYDILGGAVNHPLDAVLFLPLLYVVSLFHYMASFAVLGYLYGKLKNRKQSV